MLQLIFLSGENFWIWKYTHQGTNRNNVNYIGVKSQNKLEGLLITLEDKN